MAFHDAYARFGGRRGFGEGVIPHRPEVRLASDTSVIPMGHPLLSQATESERHRDQDWTPTHFVKITPMGPTRDAFPR